MHKTTCDQVCDQLRWSCDQLVSKTALFVQPATNFSLCPTSNQLIYATLHPTYDQHLFVLPTCDQLSCSQAVTNYLRALLPTCGQLSFLLAKPIISADNDDDKTTKY